MRLTAFLLIWLLPLISQGALVQHDGSFQPDYILRVTAQKYNQACSDRYSVLVNGSFPGPEIRIQEGQTTWIRVCNDLQNMNTTMHWHGLSAFTAPFSDGTPMASQWPIPPGHFFDYEVKVEDGYAGTYFYHSHVGFQAVTAAGALIVESSRPPPYKYDEERIIALSDFFLKTDEEIEHGLMSSPFNWSGEPAAVLMNGHGLPVASYDPTGSCQRAAIHVDPGKTYRFRLIGATALSLISIAIESHEVVIIEADGHYTRPLPTTYLQIASGQRFSVLLKAKDENDLKQSNRQYFYIQMTTVSRNQSLTTYAILQYPSAAPASLTTTLPTPPLPIAKLNYGWLDYQLRPLEDDPDFPKLGEIDRRITINVHQNFSDHVLWLQSGYDWVETFPTSPYLVQIQDNKLDLMDSYKKAIAAGSGFDKDNRIFPTRFGEVLEIVWQNQGAFTKGTVETHPFHGHGRHYYDLGAGQGQYDPVENEKRLQGTQPVLRDTTVLYGFETNGQALAPAGWRAWRIRVTDPGVWMMHCHTLQHMVMGMQTVFVFGDQGKIQDNLGTYNPGYLTFGGSAYGNKTFSPIVQHFF
ncbi:Cupredoxin [Aspergillus karnatakaensis]|uniref:Cupredoxin n=1 Tax=Aspergillus karnatakaensis TaxID=1810916 RepID=UPI003CCCCAEF